MSSYPTKSFRRTALAPGILAAIVLLAGLALLDSSYFIYFLFGDAILAAIVAVYAFQAKQWWWVVIMVGIVVCWNPLYPINWHHATLWLVLQYVGTLAFIVAGVTIKVANPDDRNRRAPAKRR
jgi:uncharacterized membrane protein